MDPDPLSKASLDAKPTAPTPVINTPLDPAVDPSIADSVQPSHSRRTPPPVHPSRARSASPRRLPPAPDPSAPPPALPSAAPRARYLAPVPTQAPDASEDAAASPKVSPTQTPNASAPPAEDSYIRDPHRLIAYIVPFPTPSFATDVPPPPPRFLIYTPPPPPLLRPSPSPTPADGADGTSASTGAPLSHAESRTQKVQRRWQEEVRAAHDSEHKVMSWGGIKARVTRGVDWAVGHVTTADLDFLTRVPKDGEAHLGGGYVPKTNEGAGAAGALDVDAAGGVEEPATGPAPTTALHTSAALTAAAPAPVPAAAVDSGAYAKEADAAQDKVDEAAGPPAYTAMDTPTGDSAPPAASPSDPPALPPRRRSSRSSLSSDSIPTLHDTPHTLVNDEDPLAPESTAPTQATVKLDEMVLIYPPSMPLTHEQLQAEFVHSLLRTKSKAQRDTIIATGLLPVTLALDWALVFVGWVFGGAMEVDAVWLASSFRGAKTARSVTKRLASTSSAGHDSLKLTFKASHRSDLLAAYLRDKCVAADRARYDSEGRVLSTCEVLDSIGWEAAGKYEAHNWEDEKWERRQVEADLATTMSKAASAWKKWCDRYEKDPEKAVRR